MQHHQRIEGEAIPTSRHYGADGRLERLNYPSGLTVAHDYSVTGYLDRVSDDDSLLTYWQADEANAEGQVTLHSAGNGTLTYDTYDPETGRLIETRTADGHCPATDASSTSPSSSTWSAI